MPTRTDRIVKKLKHIVNWVVWSLLALYVLLMVAIHLPFVQSFMGKKTASLIAEELGTEVTVKRVELGFLNRLILDDVLIYDQQEKEMVRVGRLSVKMDVLVGEELSTLLSNSYDADHSVRIINGNVLTGTVTTKDGFLGAHTSEITVIPEGDDNNEMLGWIMPRFGQFSVNRSYFSWLFGKKLYALDARVKGGERHMIMSGEYDKVLPMDIYGEYLIKAIIAGDIDKMEQLGIYEVAPEDFALAEFVDSSKLELQRIVREGLNNLRKENA